MTALEKNKNLLATVFWIGLLAGSLDILAAFLQYYLTFHRNPLRVLLFIASGVFGKNAYSGGSIMYFAGALFHYIIAYSFTLLFFFIYPQIRLLSANRVITGILYGAFIWTIMNLLIVPMSKTPAIPFHWPKALLAMGILIAAIGIPLSFFAYRHYAGRMKV
jgi:hypothetical protein